MKMNIGVDFSNNINCLNKPNWLENKNPFENLQIILSKFIGESRSFQTETEIIGALQEFKDHVLYLYNVPDSGRQYFKLACIFDEDILIKCTNLFTACLMFGKYVPHFFLEGKDEFIFPNGDKIFYDIYHENYFFEKDK